MWQNPYLSFHSSSQVLAYFLTEISELCVAFSASRVPRLFLLAWFARSLDPPLHSHCSWASQQEGVRSLRGFTTVTLSPSLRFWNHHLSIPRKGLGRPFTVNSWVSVVPNMLKSAGKWCLLLASLKAREGGRVPCFSWSSAAPYWKFVGCTGCYLITAGVVSVFNNKQEMGVWLYPRTLCGVHC